VEIHGFKKSPCILCRSIADIASLCIGNFKMSWRNMVDGSFHRFPAFYSKRFIKRSIDLISYTMIFRGINDLLIEFKNGIGMRTKLSWDFCDVCIEANAEICFFGKYLVNKLLPGHAAKIKDSFT